MAKPKAKDWVKKLHDAKGLPKIEKIDERMSKRWGQGTFVIPAPIEVDEVMRKVPRGKLVTIAEIRVALARKHATTIACPLTTGIFAWIAAHASDQEKTGGRKDPTPWWRTLKAGGELNEKYPGGAEAQQALLEAEGHVVAQRGKRLMVQGYERALARV
jgi:alkylated DNA nucleotide flippase Atl1